MTRGPEWKNSGTDPILRFLNEHRIALSPTSISYNLEQEMERPPSEATVYRALRGAKEVGLVHQPYGSLYEITERGQAYLAGDLNMDQLNQE